jgi:hypothetical protein
MSKYLRKYWKNNRWHYSLAAQTGLEKSNEYPPGTIRTHGGIQKMKTVKGDWVPVSTGKQSGGPPKYTKIKNLGGTTGGAYLVELESGEKKVLKRSTSPSHLKEEYTANRIYDVLGVPAPKARLYREGSDVMQMTDYIEGTPLGELSGEERAEAEESLREGFVADALLGNWDVLGTGDDNILWDGETAWRIDNGGALRYRAQGAQKGSKFGPEVTELDTLRDPKRSAARVFGSVTDEEIARQASEIIAKRDQILDAIADPDLRETMSKRIDSLAEQTGLAKSKGYPPGTIRTHGRVKKMKLYDGSWIPVKKLQAKADKPAGKTTDSLSTPSMEWKRKGVKAQVFKSWFGDWENDPEHASKVVDNQGRPQEQHNASRLSETPKPVYHGTATGGYTQFDPEKASEGNLYGAGFYFTEDQGIANEYLEKEDTADNVEIDHPFTPEESDEIRSYIEQISNSPRFKDEYTGDAKRTVLIEFLQPYGFYRENGRTRILTDHFVRSALARGGPLAEDVATKLDELGIDYEIRGRPQVYEVYLNIRNPFDLERDKVSVSIIPSAAERRIKEGGSATDELTYRSILKLMYPENRRMKGLAAMRGKEELNKALRDMGYDGFTHIGGRNMGTREHRVWIAFEPTQIKSTSNEGTFDPKNPDINKSLMEVFSELIKARGVKAQIGEIVVRKDGRRVQKVGPNKWKRISGKQNPTTKQREEKIEDRGEEIFDEVIAGHGLPSMVAQEVMEDQFNIRSYDDLVQFVQGQARKPSAKIAQRKDAGQNPLSKLYQSVKSELQNEFKERYGDRGDAITGAGQNMLKQLASLLIDLRDVHKQPLSEEQKLTVRYGTAAGKQSVQYKKPEESDVPQEAKQAAAKKLKGWDGKNLPSVSKVRQLTKTKWAQVTKGKIDPKRKFVIRGAVGANITSNKGIIVPFRESEEGIKVYLEQRKSGKKSTGKQTSGAGKKSPHRKTTMVSQVEVTVPYALAEDFLLQNVPQAKTRANLINQLKRSAGYKRVMGER